MDIFDFCLEIIESESKIFNICLENFISSTESYITASITNDINYDIAVNRCAYIYQYGLMNIKFAKICYTKFIDEYEDAISLLYKWNNSNLILCSLSDGPVFDYIALSLSFYLPETSLSVFNKVNLISKFGTWRHTTKIVQKVLNKRNFHLKSFSNLPLVNIEVIEGDAFGSFDEKVEKPINDSDVVMMINPIKFQQNESNDQRKFSDSLMELFGALKSDAILFCIDTKTVTAIIIDVLAKFPGKFLHEPNFVESNTCFESPDFYKNRFGCSPVLSASGVFFVWQKSNSSPAILKCLTPKLSENKINNSNYMSDENDICCEISRSCYSKTSENDVNYTLVSSSLSNNHNESDVSVFISKPLFKTPINAYHQTAKSVDVSTQTSATGVIFKNELHTFNHFKGENFSKQENKRNTSVQTEEKYFPDTNSEKIAFLSNRVVNLTKSIAELLQKSEAQIGREKKVSKCAEECEHNMPNISSQHSCLQRHSFHEPHVPRSCCMCCRENFCQNICRPKCMPLAYFPCCDVYYDRYQHSRNCAQFCNNSNFSRQKYDSFENPNIVISLNSLPKDVISQITSSLSKSN